MARMGVPDVLGADVNGLADARRGHFDRTGTMNREAMTLVGICGRGAACALDAIPASAATGR